MTEALVKKLAKAKTALILEHPFFGVLAMNMPFELDENPPPGVKPEQWTAATNGKRVKFNPHFIEPMTDEELKFLVAHEVGHPMFEHPWRRHDRDPKKWNIAGDYTINECLVNDNIGKMPEGGLQDTDTYNAGGGTTDGIYKLLPDSEEGDGPCGTGSGGEGWQDCEDGEGTQAEKDQQAAEMKVKVAQAAQAAKMMGKLSANQERLIDEVLNPKVDWREVLRRFVEKRRTDTRSFTRPNRRYLSQGIYLPSLDGEAMGELVFAIDCSGSIGADELNQFAEEGAFLVNRVEAFGLFASHLDALRCDDAQAGIFQHLSDRTGQVAARRVGLDDRKGAGNRHGDFLAWILFGGENSRARP